MTPLSGGSAVPGTSGTVLLSTATLPRPFTVPLPVPPVLRSGRMAVVRHRNELLVRSWRTGAGVRHRRRTTANPDDPHTAESIHNIGAVNRSSRRGPAEEEPDVYPRKRPGPDQSAKESTMSSKVNAQQGWPSSRIGGGLAASRRGLALAGLMLAGWGCGWRWPSR